MIICSSCCWSGTRASAKLASSSDFQRMPSTRPSYLLSVSYIIIICHHHHHPVQTVSKNYIHMSLINTHYVRDTSIVMVSSFSILHISTVFLSKLYFFLLIFYKKEVKIFEFNQITSSESIFFSILTNKFIRVSISIYQPYQLIIIEDSNFLLNS